MADVLKFKANETALSTNNTVSNTITTVNFGTAIRLFNSSNSASFTVTLSSANSANLNQSFQYANVTIAPLRDVIVRKNSTDFVNGNAAILATSVVVYG